MRDPVPWWGYCVIACVLALGVILAAWYGPRGASGDGLAVLVVPALICAFRAGQLRSRAR